MPQAARQRVAPYAEYQKSWRAKNKDWLKVRNRKWRELNPDKEALNSRRSGLRRYGITLEQYDELLEAQDGRCGICGSEDPGVRNKYFCVDHDHETGAVRGLLCHRCNVGIGYLKDDLEIVKKAVQYLSQSNPVFGPYKESTMPRGVYDRSKMKNPPAAKKEKVEKVAGAKRGRKPASMKAQNTAPAGAPLTQVGELAQGHGIDNSIYMIRDHLNTLNGTRQAVQANVLLSQKVDALIGRIVDQFETVIFPKEEAKIETETIEVKTEKSEKAPSNGAVPAPIPQAPVAFNPPAAFPG